MTQLASPPLGNPQRPPAMEELHMLWITAGLGCDGDTISITAATQPSLEDILLGVIPGLPVVRLHNPVLAYENADEFLHFLYRADEGKLDPFILVVEGSVPNEKNKQAGYSALCGRLGFSPTPCTKAAIAPATMNKPTSPPSTAARSASSSRAAGDRSCSAMSASAAG